MSVFSHYPQNFKNLILGRSTLNIADSFYAIAIMIGFVSVYHIDASELSGFALVGMLPQMMAFVYGHWFEKITDTKKWLIIFQLLHVVMVGLIIACLPFKLPIIYIYIYNFLFNLLNAILSAMHMKVVPQSLNHDPGLINKSVDIQYLASIALDILSNFLASLLLGVISYLLVLKISIPMFLSGIFFLYQLHLKPEKTTEPTEEEAVDSMSGVQHIQKNMGDFFQARTASHIVLIESFLSGATDLLTSLLPLYLVSLHVDLKWLGLVVATQRGADFFGAFLAPKIKIPPRAFFFVDYLISGTTFLLVFIVPNLFVKLLCFFICFMVIGVSGNFFEKMIYRDYEGQDMGAVFSIVMSSYSLFGILFMLIPFVYDNIQVLGVTLNALTIGFGILLARRYFKEKTTHPVSEA
ncbi:MAG: MFS transporter [Aerococcus sp.]|nr:MFS transporter [Aerococcus sp.]